MPIVDDYLTAWKQDRDSIYHQAMARWLVPAEASQVQRWLYWVALMALLLLGLVVFLVLLVRQLVKSKTAELEQKTDRLDHLAHHDPLTGLPNRLLFFDRCPPWRAKRRRVVPGSREATRDTRRAEGAKGDPKGASERGVQSYGRPVCSRNELAMLWRNAG